MKKRISHLFFVLRTEKWMTMAVLCLLICILIEFDVYITPCSSGKIATACNSIILNLSFSYIAASIFQLLVVYLPQQKRKKAIRPYLDRQISYIIEHIRLAKISVQRITFNTKELNKDEYIKTFCERDLFENYPLSQKISIYDKLIELRSQINSSVDSILSYREYLEDEQYEFVNMIICSKYLLNDIIPRDSDKPSQEDNQEEIGESIFNLYELSKKYKRNNQ